MGRRLVEVLVDDLTGEESEEVETIGFSLDGTAYEVELAPANADKFRGLFQEYIAVSRKVGGRRANRGPRKSGGPGRSPHELTAIRNWANANGYDVAPRGRIKIDVLDAYDAAH